MKTIKFYLDNGDDYRGDNFTKKECLRILKENGYKKYYQGICYYDKQQTIAGINENNTVGLKKRKENGLLYAKEKQL